MDGVVVCCIARRPYDLSCICAFEHMVGNVAELVFTVSLFTVSFKSFSGAFSAIDIGVVSDFVSRSNETWSSLTLSIIIIHGQICRRYFFNHPSRYSNWCGAFELATGAPISYCSLSNANSEDIVLSVLPHQSSQFPTWMRACCMDPSFSIAILNTIPSPCGRQLLELAVGGQQRPTDQD